MAEIKIAFRQIHLISLLEQKHKCKWSKLSISLFKAYFCGHFYYYGNGKSTINARLLHWGYHLNKQSDQIGEKQLSVLGSRGGPT